MNNSTLRDNVAYFPQMHALFRKTAPLSLITLRSDDSHAVTDTRWLLSLRLPLLSRRRCCFHTSVFSHSSSPPRTLLDLIRTISPKSAAHYDGITLHDGWVWAKAAVRTGYLANVLSRPLSLHRRGSERERGRERGTVGETEKGEKKEEPD